MPEEDMKRKRGRPRKNESYVILLKFCANEEHNYMKQALEEELDKNGSEVLREALETFYRFKINLKGD